MEQLITLHSGKGQLSQKLGDVSARQAGALLGTEDRTRGLPPTQLRLPARGSLEDGGPITGQSWEHGLSTFKIAQRCGPGT